MVEKPRCSTCRKLNELYGDEPNCHECLPPLMPENEEAYRIYSLCRNQHIMGGTGPVDLNFNAVFAVMDRYGIRDQQRTFELVYMGYRAALEKMRDMEK